MNEKRGWNPGWQVVVAFAVLGAGLTLAGNVRVATGDKGAQVFDLGELRDGESREFGQGSHRLTATREGNVVRLAGAADGERKALDATCKLDTDQCEVITGDGADDKVMVKIERRLECKNGVGDCGDLDVVALAEGMSKGVWVEQSDDCEGKDCVQREVRVVVAGHGSEGDLVFLGDGPDSVLQLGDRVMLRCPEGDASIAVEKDEAGATFLCPKHSQPMQRSEPKVIKHVVVHKDGQSH